MCGIFTRFVGCSERQEDLSFGSKLLDDVLPAVGQPDEALAVNAT